MSSRPRGRKFRAKDKSRHQRNARRVNARDFSGAGRFRAKRRDGEYS